MFSETKINSGLSVEGAEPNDKIALVDADTIAYATCSVCEMGDDEVGYSINLDFALSEAKVRIEDIRVATGCKDIELHFSTGSTFRHKLTSSYKANRATTRYPEGLRDLKGMLVKEFEGKLHSDFEADDYVVWAKKHNPEKFVLCAVDKDVLNAVEGRHFNYYQSVKYNIPMKWIVTDAKKAIQFPFYQCLMGDSADGIQGVKGCGPKTAEKIIGEMVDEVELWQEVVAQYKKAGMSEKEALLTMRLVNMNQLSKDCTIDLWMAPGE